jgi:hypothetical protein
VVQPAEGSRVAPASGSHQFDFIVPVRHGLSESLSGFRQIALFINGSGPKVTLFFPMMQVAEGRRFASSPDRW